MLLLSLNPLTPSAALRTTMTIFLWRPWRWHGSRIPKEIHWVPNLLGRQTGTQQRFGSGRTAISSTTWQSVTQWHRATMKLYTFPVTTVFIIKLHQQVTTPTKYIDTPTSVFKLHKETKSEAISRWCTGLEIHLFLACWLFEAFLFFRKNQKCCSSISQDNAITYQL